MGCSNLLSSSFHFQKNTADPTPKELPALERLMPAPETSFGSLRSAQLTPRNVLPKWANPPKPGRIRGFQEGFFESRDLFVARSHYIDLYSFIQHTHRPLRARSAAPFSFLLDDCQHPWDLLGFHPVSEVPTSTPPPTTLPHTTMKGGSNHGSDPFDCHEGLEMWKMVPCLKLVCGEVRTSTVPAWRVHLVTLRCGSRPSKNGAAITRAWDVPKESCSNGKDACRSKVRAWWWFYMVGSFLVQDVESHIFLYQGLKTSRSSRVWRLMGFEHQHQLLGLKTSRNACALGPPATLADRDPGRPGGGRLRGGRGGGCGASEAAGPGDGGVGDGAAWSRLQLGTFD